MTVQGVQGEDRTDYTKAESKLIRARSRRLLGSLLKPHMTRVVLTMVLVVIAVAANVAGPMLIAYGIDTALPAIVEQSEWMPLWVVTILYIITAIVGGVLMFVYTVSIARISQTVLFDLRRRLFDHAQRLSLEFHETYTSGRIIARQTSDLESIRDLLDQGLNELVRGILFMGFTAVAITILDPLSGLIIGLALIPAVILTRWFQVRSTVLFRETRTTSARMIVHFVETMTGIRAVQAFRTEKSEAKRS